MIKIYLAPLSLSVVILLAARMSFAQDVHNTQFNEVPTTENPAFTGMFDAALFIGGCYRTGDARTITAGIAFRSVRLGVGYQLYKTDIYSDNGGNAELALRYMAPAHLFSRKKVVAAAPAN